MTLHIVSGSFPWFNGAPAPGGKDYVVQGGPCLASADRGMGSLPVGIKVFGGDV